MRHIVLCLVVFMMTLSISAAAQHPDVSKRPSPPASTECKFADGKSVQVAYSSPRMNGRKIFGGLVPFDKVWRTGANEATTFVPSTVVAVEGMDVPAGAYTLFTLPTAGEWNLIISKQVGEWGTEYDAKQDLIRTSTKKESLPTPVENFVITLAPSSPTSCRMTLDWEATRVSVNIVEASDTKK